MYSLYLKNLIDSSSTMQGDKKILLIQDACSTPFKELLRFMYTGSFHSGIEESVFMKAKDLAVKFGIFHEEGIHSFTLLLIG